jgi:hypothetical protein
MVQDRPWRWPRCNRSNPTNFTLGGTTNNSSAYLVHFVAASSPHLQAKVVGWGMKTSTGSQSVTGVGFKPDLVLHFHAGHSLTTAPPTTGTNAVFGLPTMNGSGQLWGTYFASLDATATGDPPRHQRIDKCLLAVDNGLAVVEATFTSMDSDGFTINYSTANASAGRVVSLALRGVQSHLGSFSKSTSAAPTSQSVTGIAFRAQLLLLSSPQNTAQITGQVQTRFGFGASVVSTEASVAMQDADAAEPTSVDGVDSVTKAFVKVNNDAQTTDASADVSSFNAGGFTLAWTTNDAVATEMLYLALAAQRRVIVVGSLQ